MGYKVIYLDGEDGRPHKKCKVCEELERNVIEPVAVFLLKDKNLSDLTDKELENFDTCIFHCEKENEIWMKNLKEYKDWKKCRDEANAKGEEFNEPFEIEWEENLVNEFWNRLRAYRFAVDYWEEWEKGGDFLFYDPYYGWINNLEVSTSQTLIKSYFTILSEPKLYDFRKFIFPIFLKNYFWYRGENFSLLKLATFSGSQFLEEAIFVNVSFQEKADFSLTNFFNRARLISSRFYNTVNFQMAIFFQEADFSGALFQQWANFNQAVFLNTAYFENVQFQKTTFDKTEFQEVFFELTSFNKYLLFNPKWEIFRFVFKPILTKDSYLKISNLKVCKLNIGNITNKFQNLVFLNCSLEKDYIPKPNLSFFGKKLAEITNKLNFREYQEVMKILSKVNPNNLVLTELLKTKERINNSTLSKETKQQLTKAFFKIIRISKKVNSNLVIEDSILEKSSFINCDFSKGKIKIENSDLTDTRFVNLNWGEISEKRICPELFRDEPEKARDVYRQLKLAHDNQKDHITANEFYALEMKAYERVLEKKPWFDIKYFQKKLVFLLYRFTSTYGQSWVKPLLLLILLTMANTGYQRQESFKAVISSLVSASEYTPVFILFMLTAAVAIVLWDKLTAKLEAFLWLITITLAVGGVISFHEASHKKNFLDTCAETFNIFKLFGSSTNHIKHPFIHTLYTIATAFLIYQIIVAVRRQVRR